MGLRGHGAKPKLAVVGDRPQASVDFAQEKVSAHRSTLPWGEPGLSSIDHVIAFLEGLPNTQGSLAGTKKLRIRDWQRDFLEAVDSEEKMG